MASGRNHQLTRAARRATVWLCCAGPLCSCAATARAQAAPPKVTPGPAADSQSVAREATSEEVARWVLQLEDDHYSVREAAQRRLAAAGLAALDSVGTVAAEGALESSTRAVNVLLEWAASPDARLSLGALERIAALKNRPAEAALAVERIAELREAAAIEKFVSLGGVCRIDEQINGLNPMKPLLQAVVGPKWKGGVDGLRVLVEVPRISTLSFHAAPLDESATRQLFGLSQVKRIEFYGTPISDDAIAKLKEKLPNAAVEVRSGARLGIAGGAVPGIGGAHVVRIVPDSPAARAGLQPGDVITEIDGVAVADFQQLTKEISKCQPGQSVKAKVMRQNNPLELTVTFDRWGEEPTDPTVIPGQGATGALVPLPGNPIVIPRRR